MLGYFIQTESIHSHSGIKLGFIKQKSDPEFEYLHIPFLDYLTWVIPHKLYQINLLVELLHGELRFDSHMAMADLKCDKIMVGEILGKKSCSIFVNGI